MIRNITIELPPIRDDLNGYYYLMRMVRRIKSETHNTYTFNFRRCSIISHSAATVLGAVARYIEKTSQKGIVGLLIPNAGVTFDVSSMNKLVREYLTENNFLSNFRNDGLKGFPSREYIGYREHDEHLDADEIALHLMHHWLSDEKLRISYELKKAVVSKIFEIYMNAYGHGVISNHSVMSRVISCGFHDPKAKKLKLTVLDFGLGIVKTVKEYLPDSTDRKSVV